MEGARLPTFNRRKIRSEVRVPRGQRGREEQRSYGRIEGRQHSPSKEPSFLGEVRKKRRIEELEEELKLLKEEDKEKDDLAPEETIQEPLGTTMVRSPRSRVHSAHGKKMSESFTARFITNTSEALRKIDALLALKMKAEETLKSYSARYWEVYNDIDACDEDIVVKTFRFGLNQDIKLRRSLTKRPPISMADLMTRLEEHIRVEDDSKEFSQDHGGGPAFGQKGGTARAKPSQEIQKINGISPWAGTCMAVHTVFKQPIYRLLPFIKDKPYFEWPRKDAWRPSHQRRKALVKNGHLRQYIDETKNSHQNNEAPKLTIKDSAPIGIIDVIHYGTTSRDQRGEMRRAAHLREVFQIGDSAQMAPVPLKRESTEQIVFTNQDLEGVQATPLGCFCGFSGETVVPSGKVTINVRAGTVSTPTEFFVLNAFSPYNAILGRPWLHRMGAVPSTLHQRLRAGKAAKNVFLKEKCAEKLVLVSVAEDEAQRQFLIGDSLSEEHRTRLLTLLKEYQDIFAWTPYEAPGVDSEFVCHALNVSPEYKPIVQRARRTAPQHAEAVREEVERLLKIGAVKGSLIPTVAIQHRHQLVDSTAGHERMSFLDAFQGYHQIALRKEDQEKTAFITPRGIFCYKVMPFGLKNAGATYQRMVTKMFSELLGKTVEVYIDDMVVKSIKSTDHVEDLRKVFEILRRPQLKAQRYKVRIWRRIRESFWVSWPCSGVRTSAVGYPNGGLIWGHMMGSDLGVVLISPGGELLEQAVRLGFGASNNEAEYEALLHGLRAAKRLGADLLTIYCDSQLIVNQLTGEYMAKDERMVAYRDLAKDLLKGFRPYLLCVHPDLVPNLLYKIHEGVCGGHTGGRSLAHRAIGQGYWMAIYAEGCGSICQGAVRKCQLFAPAIHKPASQLNPISSPWPFAQWGLDLVGPLPRATGNRQWLIVATDYFTNPAYPQGNGQAESSNKTILQRKLRKGWKKLKGDGWRSCLPYYGRSEQRPRSSTGETPFSLTYGVEVVIPLEVGLPTLRSEEYDRENNELMLAKDMDLAQERRDLAMIRLASYQGDLKKRYGKNVSERSLAPGDLVLRKVLGSRKDPTQGKLGANWEGPYQIISEAGLGAFNLKGMDGKPLKRPWNISNLKKFYQLFVICGAEVRDDQNDIKTLATPRCSAYESSSGMVERHQILAMLGVSPVNPQVVWRNGIKTLATPRCSAYESSSGMVERHQILAMLGVSPVNPQVVWRNGIKTLATPRCSAYESSSGMVERHQILAMLGVSPVNPQVVWRNGIKTLATPKWYGGTASKPWPRPGPLPVNPQAVRMNGDITWPYQVFKTLATLGFLKTPAYEHFNRAEQH
uniref:Uncharacterized protein n=1 Tax=Fagus sylvatica TaxID=28930 RepID=A0A2N9FYE8_FAGSY